MNDLRSTIVPKSDQLNADDLLGGGRTIRITRVIKNDGADQPVAINFEGDNGRPWKPCKSMRRVLIQIWGPDGTAYVGRSVTIFRDPTAMFGGMAVGGIRISHMSHMEGNKPRPLALTEKKGSKKIHIIKPLESISDEAELAARGGLRSLRAWWRGLSADQQEQINPLADKLKVIATAADASKGGAEKDPFGLPPAMTTDSALMQIAGAMSVAHLMGLWAEIPPDIADDEAVYAAYEAKRDELQAREG